MTDLFYPEVSNRFLASFFFSGIPSPLDISFHRISGLNRELGLTPYYEGGANVTNNYFSHQVQCSPLILERGVTVATPLTITFDQVMSRAKATYINAVIMLLNDRMLPVCSWIVSNAIPVRWETGELNAASNNVMINTLELRCQEIQVLGVKL